MGAPPLAWHQYEPCPAGDKLPARHFIIARSIIMAAARLLWLLHYTEGAVGAGDDDVIDADQALREAERAAGLDHVALDTEPLSDLAIADIVDSEADRDQRTGPAQCLRAAVAHRIVSQGCDQAAVDAAAAIGVRLGDPQPQDDRLFGSLRIERLPGIGERALARMRFETARDGVGGHRR